MKMELITEGGKEAHLEFCITESDGFCGRRFGIRETMYIDGTLVEEECADERFFTRAEAEKTVEMLCKYEVTPCTLCDII